MKAGKHCSILIVLLFFSFSAVSCVSHGTTVFVPNERDVIMSNLAAEYCAIGESYIELKKYSKAVAAYQKALSLEPADASIRYSLAGAQVLNKQWSDAVDSYRILLKKDPDNTSIRLSLAYAYAQQNEFEDAIQLYRSLYEENPLNTNVLTNYGLIMVHQEQYDIAQKLLDELIVLLPDGEGTKKLSDALQEAQKVEEEETKKSDDSEDTVNSENSEKTDMSESPATVAEN